MGSPVFPSLARGIAWASSQKIEDGTIRDKMEMGQAMTRQRYSRLRRTWKVKYEHLNQTDIAAIDFFCRNTVQGGALPFYWPNLIANGGFEYNTQGPAAGTLVTSGLVCDGWTATESLGGVQAQLAAGAAHSGAYGLELTGIESAVIPANGNLELRVFSASVPVKPGQTVQSFGYCNVPVCSLPSGVIAGLRVGMFLGGTEFIPSDLTGLTAGWTSLSISGVAPTGATSMYAQCAAILHNTTGSAIAMPATAWLTAQFDDVGLALVSPTPTYGNMPSNGSIPVAVRFAKPIEIADAGWVNGGPSYHCQFEMEEV